LFAWLTTKLKPWKPNWRGRIGTVGLLIDKGCFVKKKNIVSIWKVFDMNYLVQGGQQYWSFPFSKISLFSKVQLKKRFITFGLLIMIKTKRGGSSQIFVLFWGGPCKKNVTKKFFFGFLNDDAKFWCQVISSTWCFVNPQKSSPMGIKEFSGWQSVKLMKWLSTKIKRRHLKNRKKCFRFCLMTYRF